MTRGRLLQSNSRPSAQVSLAIVAALTLVAAMIFLLGPSTALMLTVGAGGALTAYARPSWVMTASPFFIPAFFLGLRGFSQALIPLFGIVVAGALVARRGAVPLHALIPIGLAVLLLIREVNDPTGQIGPFSAFTMTVTGLIALTAAIVAPPNLDWFLLSIAALGVIFSVAGVTSGVFTENNRAEDVLAVNANGVALIGAAGVVAGATLLLRSDSALVRIVGAILGAISFGGMIIGQSQGAILGATAGLLVLFWMWKRWSVMAIGFVSLGLYAVTFGTNIAEQLGGANRVASDLESSRFVRAQVADQAWSLFLTEPFFGVGRGNAAVYIMSGYSTAPGDVLPVVPHNVLLQILAMAGLLGLMMSAIPVLLLLVSRGDGPTRILIAPLLVLFAVSSFTFEWHISVIILLPAVALGAWSASKNESRKKKVPAIPPNSGAFPASPVKSVSQSG